MEQYFRLRICKGIIQYLLETSNYSLKDIAIISNSSIKQIRSIYNEEQLPDLFSSEINLVEAYRAILLYNSKKKSTIEFKL